MSLLYWLNEENPWSLGSQAHGARRFPAAFWKASCSGMWMVPSRERKKSGKEGLFEIANNGTLFLDEIGEMSLGIQGKLLRVLQERCIMRLSDTKTAEVEASVDIVVVIQRRALAAADVVGTEPRKRIDTSLARGLELPSHHPVGH